MKSPPLLVAALVACIVVLGFNYWFASSRSVDLQVRIMDLEGKVQRAAAERGAVELKKNEFQGELEKQRQQIDKIQSLHSFQMENANRVHQEEKGDLDRQNGCSNFCALKWCGHMYTSVPEQKLPDSGDLTYPDLRPLESIGVSWEEHNEEIGSGA
ncbi:PREDICTED: Golgi membrane protein 1-like [Mesitornis unicolor]|uniref:Golgi membrane protein 1-like n=1 Tax=Mesitornis unicolor TaxID=54374 RepID=UPI0005292BE5|nr:PREDICTED: Golgi membrane protein 1-like [Mesitornis unicolor]